MQKARGHPVRRHRAPTACKRTVSGSISLSLQEFFSPFPHGTMRYRSSGSIQPWKMVLPDSHKVSRAPWYSGTPQGGSKFRVRGFHPLWRHFPESSATHHHPMTGPHNPEITVVTSVWANPRSLAATSGISVDFFSWGYLDVSVPPVCLIHLCIQCMMAGHNPCRVSPFGNLRVKACLAALRSLSQLTTSFIAYRCQGIHHTPLIA
eukprot:TRINITY_DN1221_c0_g1_i5.p1 TRINITY_DN1221_c0_g1~~TRINITY_DN1221_c0_g1_i5.p1  ORF type:complete len:206 (-),score=-29.96 TRINITY_DN1221_c0_g1_i5:24-641(-)